MTVAARVGCGLAVAGIALLTAAWDRPANVPFGFSAASAREHARVETAFLAAPNAERIRNAHEFLTRLPHPAGTPRDRALAAWTRDAFRDAGLEDVGITTHEVWLPWPTEVSVEMTAPRAWRASLREEPARGDPFTQPEHADPGIPFHAYSASGEVTAPVVYAGNGHPEDYDWLAARGIEVRGRIALVRYSVPYSYRGFKAYAAQQRGVAGLLIFSDPAVEGTAGDTYPAGTRAPTSYIERGGIGYDFLAPGDPLTPGWASVDGAPRIQPREAVSLPSIVSAPLSFDDARVILAALGGREVPAHWQGAEPFPYRTGDGSTTVRMRVQADERVRPVWTVTGSIRGAIEPDHVVLLGNHRDAWIYGGVDPSSGSAALIELARTLGELVRNGWRPRRTIMFASWDAEEYALASSTEWAEQHQDWLRKNAVAYLNVDSAVSGPHLALTSVPALNQVLDEVVGTVRDPVTRLTLAAAARDRQSRQGGARPRGTVADLVDNRIGGGSDYTVFLNHLGVPVVDLSFRGSYGVYHSIYDNHHLVSTLADPGFRYHVTMVQTWGLLALRLASADVVPLDYEPYAQRVEEFLREAGRLESALVDDVRAALGEIREAAGRFNRARETALTEAGPETLLKLNVQLITAERALLDPDGLPGRPWFRHTIYAPQFTYAPAVLPGVTEAIAAGDVPRTRAQSARLSAALRRVASALDGAAP